MKFKITRRSDPGASAIRGKAFTNGADAVIAQEGQSLALWWSEVPSVPGQRIGCLGGLEIADATTGLALSDAATVLLREHGCTMVVGPMDGNTWRTHRAIVASSGRLPFLLEPTTPDLVATMFRGAGFFELERYSSSSVDLTSPAIDFRDLGARMDRSSVTLRAVTLPRLRQELEAIHELSLRAFRDNFLYTPLSVAEFIAMYERLGNLLVADFVQLAECERELVGFVFGYPDALAVDPGRTLVVKTLAVLPERRFAGLGTLLVNRVQTAARQRGFKEAIHALQRQDNQSLRISERFGATVFREYALFSKRIGEAAP